ncbi:MAG TPA: DUF456 domain-containing protein [Longimicrobiaceae bacterium]|nr:DUF456 domain-containing protein [Longimicrobiaceae bacterium]
MAYLLLVLAQVTGLVLIPFGLPGLWLQAGALAAFGWWTDFTTVGFVPIALALFLALLAEIAEFLLGGRYARRYGGGRRAAVGAIIGGIVGAIVGLPVPLIGSVIGAFVGSFIGAAVLEWTRGEGTRPAVRAGWGAFLGRVVATALKGGVGVVIAVLSVLTALS